MLDEADLFLLPSHAEGLPVSMLEAMAAGLPVIVTPVGGIPEAIQDGRNGLLAQPRNPEELAAAIRRLLTDEGLRSRLGQRARQTVREHFDIGVAVGRLRTIYREAVAGTD
jgi:glycosyltransferase involved in cell wall biosynthesis